MNNLLITSIEPLEQRIAPAGLVTAIFVNGLLTISGDGNDHDVSIVKTGSNTFRVEGNATAINTAGVLMEDFRGVLLNVLINGGAGADTFAVTNLSPLKSFTFHGNAGVDSLSTANLVTTAAGRVDIDLGSEAGSVNFFGSQTTIHGALNIDLGGGGTAGLRSAITTVDGDVTVTGGAGADELSLSGDSTLFKHKLTFLGQGGDDTFTTLGTTLSVLGNVALDGGGGSNHFLFGTDNHKFGTTAPGLVELKLGVGPGDVTFLGKSTSILGELKIDLGSGGGTAHLDSAVTTVRNTVQVDGGAGDDTVEIAGRTSIGGDLTFLGGVGQDKLKATGALLAVKGATTMNSGVGASAFEVNVLSLALASLSVTGGSLNDTVSIIANGLITGDVNLQLGTDGTGGSSTTLQSVAGLANGLKVGGNVTIAMGGETVDFLTIANLQVTKGFTAQTGSEVSTVAISKLTVVNDFTLGTGVGADVVNLDSLKTRDFHFEAGDGADVVNLDNFQVRAFSVDTGVGADQLRIERNAAFSGAAQVLGNATILTGIGADQIRIGNGSDHASLKVSFMGSMLLDAGNEANERNDILASNFFEMIPQIVTTGGSMTQTTAA
ncbi:MAG: hypothetical protein QOE70_3355 [Chthoniobacter sp.]|jgi:hypothetical protein|nr:hypothetical protein [Chthoniobacter sp.]